MMTKRDRIMLHHAALVMMTEDQHGRFVRLHRKVRESAMLCIAALTGNRPLLDLLSSDKKGEKPCFKK